MRSNSSVNYAWLAVYDIATKYVIICNTNAFQMMIFHKIYKIFVQVLSQIIQYIHPVLYQKM